jgi:putative PIN family toxin of toxin-antitoxin system
MRVVLDTNVIIAAFATRGLCADVLEHCLYEHTLIFSEPLLDEIHESICKKIHAPKPAASTLRKFLADKAKIVVPVDLPKDACRDPDDIVVLGTAAAGAADVIVTGDNDLLIIKKFQTILVLTPREFWEFVQKKTAGQGSKK